MFLILTFPGLFISWLLLLLHGSIRGRFLRETYEVCNTAADTPVGMGGGRECRNLNFYGRSPNAKTYNQLPFKMYPTKPLDY